MGRCRAGKSFWHCPMRYSMAHGGSLASLGLWQVFMAPLPALCLVLGMGLWFGTHFSLNLEMSKEHRWFMPPLGTVLGQVSITTSSCLVSPWPTHPVQSPCPPWITQCPPVFRVAFGIQAGPAQPLLLTPGSSLPCWLLLPAPLLPLPGAAHGHPLLGLLGWL